MNIQRVPFVSESEFLRSLTDGEAIAEVAGESEVGNVSFGDASYTLIDVARYKKDVLSAYSDDLSEEQADAVNAGLDALPEGTYIDLEN